MSELTSFGFNNALACQQEVERGGGGGKGEEGGGGGGKGEEGGGGGFDHCLQCPVYLC